MLTKSILAGAAIALAATIGSASAGEQFTTLEGVTAVAMSSTDLDAVVGGAKHVDITTPKGTRRILTSFVAAGFHHIGSGVNGSFDGGHLQNAEDHSGGVIDVCGYGADGGGCS